MATAFTNAQVVSGSGQPKTHKLDIFGRNTATIKAQVVNFDAIATATGQAVAVGDTYPAINIEAGEVVLGVGVKRRTAVTAAGVTADLGFTGGTVDYFVDGLDISSISTTTQVNCMDGMISLSAADTIDVLIIGDSPAGGVIEVWAVILRI